MSSFIEKEIGIKIISSKRVSSPDGMDHFIGNEDNKLIDGSLHNPIKHSLWKDGELSIPCLMGKAEVPKMKSLIW